MGVGRMARGKDGRVAGPVELRRTIQVRSCLRPGEAADLEAVAEGWGVPIGTAAWAIIAERLAEWRAVSPDLGRVGVVRAAASAALLASGIPAPE